MLETMANRRIPAFSKWAGRGAVGGGGGFHFLAPVTISNPGLLIFQEKQELIFLCETSSFQMLAQFVKLYVSQIKYISWPKYAQTATEPW